MKTFFVALVVAALAAFAQHAQHAKPAPQESHAAHAAEVVKRGEPLGDSPLVAFADIFKEPQKYAGKSVRVEGVVARVCQAEGCWMQITPAKADADGATAVRVTFDHKFAVPKDAAKMQFRAEGVFSVKTLSKETVEHLVKEDGAKIKANPDGTAHELSFVATGVELWK
jgi:Domain of unknown function (DUF4920)